MTEKEMMQKNIEEFARLQKYMILTQDKESAAYKEMKGRYVELKVILTTSGVNLTELDIVKEQNAIKITVSKVVAEKSGDLGIGMLLRCMA